LATGDYFRTDVEGYLYFVGRRDELVKIQDQRISLSEVEHLARMIPGVAEASAWVEARSDIPELFLSYEGELNERELRSRLIRLVSVSAQVPAVLVRVERLPRNENGKVVRTSTLEALVAKAP
jgi:acyl-coenzyme A synthetase/AMP-(fatty) acid ligase